MIQSKMEILSSGKGRLGTEVDFRAVGKLPPVQRNKVKIINTHLVTNIHKEKMLNLSRWNNAKYELIYPTYLRPSGHYINFSFKKADGNPFVLLVGLQPVLPLWETIWIIFKKQKLDILYDPAIPLPGTNPKETGTLI